MSSTESTYACLLLKGSLIGAIEAAVNHPLWTLKTRMQSNQSFTIRPSVLYSGIGVNMFSMVPITTVQVSVATVLNKNLALKAQDPNSLIAKLSNISTAFVAGALSALVSTPAELMMISKRNGRHIYCFSQAYVGGAATALRDGIFTVGFLVAPKIIEAQMLLINANKEIVSKLSGPAAGIIAATLSHPFDTIKTLQQANGSSVKQIISTQPILNLYRGYLPRSARVISAVSLMDYSANKLQPYLG